MKRTLAVVGALLAIALAIGALVLFGGFYNVAASQPHNPVLRWILEVGMQRSVAFHAGNPASPDLDDPRLVMQGVRHFATNCAPCHGAPGVAPIPAAAAMLPVPPNLGDRVDRFSDAELFWIIDNGLKYTGMPGWPVDGREDEVWAVVAFVRLLPEMGAAGYAALTAGPESPDVPLATDPSRGAGITDCAGCHGFDGGGGPTGAFPRLAGLPLQYIADQLDAFAAGTRPSGIMAAALVGLDAGARQAAAEYFAALPPAAAAAPPGDPALVEQGAIVAAAGFPDREVPPCAACHDNPNAAAPRIAGQSGGYIEQQLRLFRTGTRTHNVMNFIAARLSDAEVAALAAYYANRAP